ncbi:hypothetical protein DNTS_033434 [Danionella cerebrum]|uniref:non-specific serine/threonine protein kinase n=1 Tax=Danionella cerebrum TaxID=2873325 RepID=A0A553R961_9TELE|nr:hypothetical protein DNTS_033434 [Danionella translucida]
MPDAGTDMGTDDPRTSEEKASVLDIGNVENVIRKFYHTKKVGDYLVGKKLGEGSFAKVHLGLHAITGEKVAVKVIDKKKAKRDSYVLMHLRREGQIQQMIRHPHITQLMDILETSNGYYLILELCPGGNLMNKLYEKKRLDEGETFKYISQLVMAVEHLHRSGVVHRDLKIENLLLDDEDNIKLIDFGLSNFAGILGYVDPFSTQCGSPAYAAPELLSRKKYGPKVDIWSIGVNMYAMLTGTLPFTVEPFNLRALHQKMVDRDMNPLPPSISPAAVEFLHRLLEPDPAERPSIHEVMTDPWLHMSNPHTGASMLNRIHIEDINHTVLKYMTEKMGYKQCEVLSAVLTNKACSRLTVYFLLIKKLKRLSKCNKEKEKTVELDKKNELFQTHWRKHIDKVTIPPKQTPVYFAMNKDHIKEKKPKTGLLKAVTGGFKDVYSGHDGCITSSSLEFMEIHPLHPTPEPMYPTPETQPPLQDISTEVSKNINTPARPPSSLGSHSWTSERKESNKDAPPSPWYKLSKGVLSPPRHVSAFQPDSSYLKKVTIPSPPVLIVKPQPRKSAPASDSVSSSDSTNSPPSSRGMEEPNNNNNNKRTKFRSIGIGQIFTKKVHPFKLHLPLFKPVQVVEVNSHSSYNQDCATEALKTLC